MCYVNGEENEESINLWSWRLYRQLQEILMNSRSNKTEQISNEN
ncbi:MAG: hypothetical protein V3S79_02415 [Candidatus Thermoplasmatota archaeon]